MPATGRIKKGPPSTQKLCRKPPAERGESRSQVPPPREGQNPHSPAPLARAGTRQSRTCCHWVQQERKADLGTCFALWDPAALDAGLCFQEHLVVLFLAMTGCYEMHKQCRRRPSCLQKATYYFAAVYREVKNRIRTDCHFQKNLHSAALGLLCFGFHFFSFYSYHTSV